MQKDYKNYAQQLFGAEFKDLDLFITAFTHRSYMNEHKKSAKEHNERMEFLGDAVLELVVTSYLYETYEEAEGVLTNWRSALVRTESISEAAEKLGFEEYLRLSRGERRGSKRAREQILANTFEAVIGAIYLDQGYEEARQFITNHLLINLPGIIKSGSWEDPKSKLQELAQEKYSLTPVYKVLDEQGPDHEKIFTVGVFIGQDKFGEGQGSSKQAAQQAAAETALEDIKV